MGDSMRNRDSSILMALSSRREANRCAAHETPHDEQSHDFGDRLRRNDDGRDRSKLRTSTADAGPADTGAADARPTDTSAAVRIPARMPASGYTVGANARRALHAAVFATRPHAGSATAHSINGRRVFADASRRE